MGIILLTCVYHLRVVQIVVYTQGEIFTSAWMDILYADVAFQMSLQQ